MTLPASWLRDYELTHLGASSVHGVDWRSRRDLQTLDAGVMSGLVPLLPGFKTWVAGLGLFGVAAVAALVHALLR